MFGGVEYSCLNGFGLDNPKCDYITTFVIVMAVFLLLLKNPGWSPFGLHYIGKEYSLWIYLLHMNIQGRINWITDGRLSKVPLVVMDILKVIIAYIVCVLIAFVIKRSYLFLKIHKNSMKRGA